MFSSFRSDLRAQSRALKLSRSLLAELKPVADGRAIDRSSLTGLLEWQFIVVGDDQKSANERSSVLLIDACFEASFNSMTTFLILPVNSNGD